MSSSFKIFKVPTDWKALDYPDKELGSASITHHRYTKGKTFLMENVDGYELMEVNKSFPVTELRINKKVVMIDDPMHYIGMQRLAEHSKGRVLVGGLGLGIVVKFLLKNPRVTLIDVVELNKDVIDLISPLLPPESKLPYCTIYNDDIRASRWVHGHYDTIILDIWVKRDKKPMQVAGQEGDDTNLISLYYRFVFNNLKTKVFVFGSRNPKMNSAVKEPREIYLQLIKDMRS